MAAANDRQSERTIRTTNPPVIRPHRRRGGSRRGRDYSRSRQVMVGTASLGRSFRRGVTAPGSRCSRRARRRRGHDPLLRCRSRRITATARAGASVAAGSGGTCRLTRDRAAAGGGSPHIPLGWAGGQRKSRRTHHLSSPRSGDSARFKVRKERYLPS